jgi:FAD/FMN-containing dehydrogenase
MFSSHFGYTIDTAALDQSLQKLLPDVIADDRKSASFFFVEAGMTLNFLNILLDSQTPRVALNTMGGASAQTIAGAISTGTHGGDFDRQPLADSVRAIYLVGAGGAHHWIEPANPITAPEKIQATFPCIPAENVHYDDDFFRAALVSMGAMGVIYAVILEVVPQYSLMEWNKWSTWEDLNAESGPDFTSLFNGSWSGLADFLVAWAGSTCIDRLSRPRRRP